MKSKNLSYIAELDHLRLLAALLILAFHWFHSVAGQWQPLPGLAWMALVTEGYTGVSLFFVLSGFVLTLIGLGRPGFSYRDFLTNRVLRIAPLFLVVFVLALSINRDGFRAADLLYVLATNIGDPPTSKHFLTGAAWSISVEFAFYLVFPFLLRFERGNHYLLRLVAIMLVLRCGAYLVSERATLMIYSTLVGRLDQFLIGMLAALAWQRGVQGWSPARGRALLGASLVLLWAALWWQARQASFFSPAPKNPAWIVWPTLEALLWAGVLVGYLGAGLRWPGAVGAWLARAGSWSFSLYMWHALVIVLALALAPVSGATAKPWLALHFLAVLAAALGFSALSFHTIERPFLDMRVAYGRKEESP